MKNTNNGPTTIQAPIRCHRRSPGDSAPQLQLARANAENLFPALPTRNHRGLCKMPDRRPRPRFAAVWTDHRQPGNLFAANLARNHPTRFRIHTPPCMLNLKPTANPSRFETAHGQGSPRVMEVYIMRLYRKLSSLILKHIAIDPDPSSQKPQNVDAHLVRFQFACGVPGTALELRPVTRFLVNS